MTRVQYQTWLYPLFTQSHVADTKVAEHWSKIKKIKYKENDWNTLGHLHLQMLDNFW